MDNGYNVTQNWAADGRRSALEPDSDCATVNLNNLFSF